MKKKIGTRAAPVHKQHEPEERAPIVGDTPNPPAREPQTLAGRLRQEALSCTNPSARRAVEMAAALLDDAALINAHVVEKATAIETKLAALEGDERANAEHQLESLRRLDPTARIDRLWLAFWDKKKDAAVALATLVAAFDQFERLRRGERAREKRFPGAEAAFRALAPTLLTQQLAHAFPSSPRLDATVVGAAFEKWCEREQPARPQRTALAQLLTALGYEPPGDSALRDALRRETETRERGACVECEKRGEKTTWTSRRRADGEFECEACAPSPGRDR